MALQTIFLKIAGWFTLKQCLSLLNLVLISTTVWCAGMLAANVTDQYLPYQKETKKRFVPTETRKLLKSKSFNRFKPIITHNVFNAEVDDKPVVVVTESAPVVKIGISLQKILDDLELVGVYKGERSYCILKSIKERKEDIFGINEDVFETGAKIKRIVSRGLTQKVYIRYNGETGILTVKEKQDQEPGKTVQTVRSSRSSTKKRVTNPNPASEYSKNGRDFYIRSSEVDAQLNNFAQLLNQARVVPYFKNGENLGYKIKAIDKGSLYEKLGLKNNDIIQKINGQEINSPEKAFELLKLLRNEREITLNLTRQNEPISLNYHIN